MDRLQALKGKSVEVIYQSLSYKGTLIGASDTEVYLQTSSSRVVLPLSGVSAVRESTEGKR